MRSLLVVLALFFVVGVEFATGAFAFAQQEFLEGLRLLWIYEKPDIFPGRFALGFGLMLVNGVALGGILLLRLKIAMAPKSKKCPRCSRETRRVHRQMVQRVLGKLTERRIDRRRCSECEWTGTVVRS